MSANDAISILKSSPGALTKAVRDAEAIRTLLRQGADVNEKDGSGNTVLFYAMNGPIGIIRLLIDNGANVNEKGSSDTTPLMWAAMREKTEVVQLLIDSGAAVNAADSFGFTALMKSAMDGDLKTGRLLVERGARVEQEDNLSRTAADWAEFWKHPEFAEMLTEAVETRRLRAEEKVRTAEKELHDAVVAKQQQLGAHAPKAKPKPGPQR